jgi:hypothetical protein
MNLPVLASRSAALFAVTGFAFAAAPANAQYYGYGCGSCCNSCGTSYYYTVPAPVVVAPAPVVVQPVAPCGGCGGYGGYAGYYGVGYGAGYPYGGYRWGYRRWGW